MIICAAIKLIDLDKDKFLVMCGYRHRNCYEMIPQLDEQWRKIPRRKVVEGFITHTGEFLDRTEAYKYAVMNGQLSTSTIWYKNDHGDTELYSEDLY